MSRQLRDTGKRLSDRTSCARAGYRNSLHSAERTDETGARAIFPASNNVEKIHEECR